MWGIFGNINLIPMMKTYKILLSFFLILISGVGFSQSVPSYVPTNGLVGWWGFNGNAQDGSGNGNHGTVNGATLTTDRFGNQNSAFNFDGVDDWIQVDDHATLRPNHITISAWIYVNTPTINPIVTKTRIGNPFGLDGGEQYCIFQSPYNYQNTAGSFQIKRNGGCQNGGVGWYRIFQTNLPFSTGQWQHIVGTYDGDTMKLYNNGLLSGFQVPPSGPIDNCSNGTFNIGRGWVNYDFYNGKMDNLGMWNRALTQQEITNLYNSQLPAQTSLCLPTITTSSPSSVGVDSVVIGGNIRNDGGSSIVLRGVCYSTSTNPNMGNQRTEDGSGIGSFNTVLRGLTSSTTYYARSYAKNSNGVVVYGNEVSFSTSSINIGSNYAGGIVFYVDSTGQHGLVCAPNDQGVAEWGCNCFEIGGLIFSLGSGLTNTNRITSICLQTGIAAQICSNLELNGFFDWYLPSINELQLMWNNLRGTPNSPTPNLANFSTQSPYWSSSEPSNYPCYALAIDFWQGNMVTRNKYMGQNYGSRVRAIRSF